MYVYRIIVLYGNATADVVKIHVHERDLGFEKDPVQKKLFHRLSNIDYSIICNFDT
jgi:hypothetical protein